MSIVAVIVGLDTYYLGEVIIGSLTWNPFLNAISAVVFIKPYRRYCSDLICPCASERKTIMVQSVTDTMGNPRVSSVQ
jgi:hypothetical protein